MNIIVTGSPGTGKTTLAKNLAKYFSYDLLNEKDFALQHKIGEFNDSNELEIPVKEFEKEANKFLSKKQNFILEGHVVCEMRLNVDKVILLRVDPELLELRLETRNYPPEKIMDNVFVEGIEYCKKHLLKNYSLNKIIEISSDKTEKETLQKALNFLE
jgi:adenylate kinase